MGGSGIYLGKMVGKKAVLPLIYYCYPEFDRSVKGISITDDRISYGYDASTSNGYEVSVINLDKLSDSDFSKLLSLAETSDNEMVFYAFDETIFSEAITPNTYPGKLATVHAEIPKFDEPQPIKVENPASNRVFTEVEVPPTFPGGMGAMMAWLSQNVRYPAYAQEMNVQGRVLVKFVVLPDGSLDQVQIAKGVSLDLDNEAIRVVKAMPKWTPGTIDGKPVKVLYTIPVTFRLN